jgi:hypothetical protein
VHDRRFVVRILRAGGKDDALPQIALGSGGRLAVMSVQVLPSSVFHKRCRRVIEPTQPSVGLVKLMHRSQVSASTVCWSRKDR